MGTYNLNVKELTAVIVDALQNVEGDYSDDTLHDALERAEKEIRHLTQTQEEK